MAPVNVQWLASQEGQQAIEDLRGVDPLKARRVVPNLGADQIAAALTQAAHRPSDFPLPLVTVDGIQQATPIEVALRRAERLRASGARRVVDAGCGIGVDSWAFSRVGLEVLAYESDPLTAQIAQANNPDIEVITADVTTTDLPDGVLYVDPARRRKHADEAGRPVRINDPAQWSPPWPWVLEQTAVRPVVARVRPGLRGLPVGAEWHCTSVDRHLVDATLWFGDLADTDRRASVRHRGDWHEVYGPPAPATIGDPAGHILDPDPAIVRSGLVSNAAALLGGRMLDPDLAFITCDQPTAWVGRSATVLEEVGFRDVKNAAARHSIRRVTVWSRGFDTPPRFGLREGADGVVVAARMGPERTARAWLAHLDRQP